MRPLKLRLQGFTCYRQPVEVDFSALDLFAITGPTGSGKSSLLHGMTYALYGRIPGFGNEVKELISQGSDHLQVKFEFAVDGQRYAIVRRAARRGAPHVQLFRIDNDGREEGLTDRARATEEKVRELLGLDFEGFTRSVLLPQGQFHQFLAGRPEERRKVLADLLRLDIYNQIMQAANEEAKQYESGAASLRQRLQEDFLNATPEALAEKKGRLQALESQAQGLSALWTALQRGQEHTGTLSSAQAHLVEARTQLADQEAALAEARRIVDSGEEHIQHLDRDLEEVEKGLAQSPFRPDTHRSLQLALMPAREHEQALQERDHLQAQVEEQEAAARRARSAEGQAKEAAARAREAQQRAELDLEKLRRRHAAADLRQGLKPGDPCPVCARPLTEQPPVEHVALDEAVEQHRQARQAAETADQAAAQARQRTALAQQALETARLRLDEAGKRIERWKAQLQEQMGTTQPFSLAEIEARWQAQEQARQRHEQMEKERQRLQTERQRLKEEFQRARGELAARQTAVGALRAQVQQLEAEARGASEALAELARQHGWQDVLDALAQGKIPDLRGRAQRVDQDYRSVQQEIGGLKADIQRLTDSIQQAVRLRQEEADLTRRARLARDLAGLLRADRFQAYMEEAALGVLAEDGSRLLDELSDHRYRFAVEGQEFQVVDRWNGDQIRSVRTLSGGETFLASLALALALAQGLPELGAATARSALESLFLDEGFSSLDVETRDAVAGALEQLHQDGTRMVGIITHDGELAERMPYRITVLKSETGSTLSTEEPGDR